ncbi:MAG: hypothetical protein IKU72_01115 [Oscillospiraceae bacterium]|nr:hypothetical protein [Oscillospiraceae bacterium]
MLYSKNRKFLRVWLIALTLFVCLGTTSAALVTRFTPYLPDDSGAIPLVPEQALANHEQDEEQPTHPEGEVIPPQPDTNIVPQQNTPAESIVLYNDNGSRTTYNRFETTNEDGTNPWATMTPVEIFRTSYSEDGYTVTVQSGNGDKIIAPGTENKYTFKLKNNASALMDYTVSMEATIQPAGITIPVEGRMSRYDGLWVAGGEDSYVDITAMNGQLDQASLHGGRFVYYTLDWRWPFDGNDELDTLLGDMAAHEDISLTIVITTTATERTAPPGGGGGGGSDPDDPIGIIPPDTGDISQSQMWMIIALIAFALLMLLMFAEEREKRRNPGEA